MASRYQPIENDSADEVRVVVSPFMPTNHFARLRSSQEPASSRAGARSTSTHLTALELDEGGRLSRGTFAQRWRLSPVAGWRSFGRRLSWSNIKAFIKGAQKETPKSVLTRNKWYVVWTIFVHLIPVSAIISLAIFNLQGLYIGRDLRGFVGDYWVKLDIFSLQVTTKLIEIAAVASLGLVLTDVVKVGLLEDDQGLPFIILGSQIRFSDMKYLLSPAFWMSIALLIGPSSAALAIPAYQDGFPAGQTSYFLRGNNTTLWPLLLDAASAGGAKCSNRTAEEIRLGPVETVGCAWGGWSLLSEYFRNLRYAGNAGNVTLNNGFFNYDLTVYQHCCGDKLTRSSSWAFTGHLATSFLANRVQVLWGDAIWAAPVSSAAAYAGFKHYPEGGPIFTSETWLPAAQVQCEMSRLPFTQLQTSPTWFPVLPQFDFYQGIDYVFTVDPTQSSQTVAQWIPIPQRATPTYNTVTRNFSGNTTDYPSAFLLLQVPNPNATEPNLSFACTIDARWTDGDIIAFDPHWTIGPKILHNRENITVDAPTDQVDIDSSVPFDPLFRPINNASWQTIKLGMDWLNMLTPALNSSGYNTLAQMLDETDIQSRINLSRAHDWRTRGTVESLIATVVVDGMSRVGFWDQLTGIYVEPDLEDAPTPYTNVSGTDLNHFFVQQSQSVVPRPTDLPAGQITELQWTMETSGWGYQTSTLSAKVALVIMFADGAIILGHMFYILWSYLRHIRLRDGGYECMKWGTFDDIVALSRVSGAGEVVPEALVNTSAGVGTRGTLKSLVKIRASARTSGGGWSGNLEELQLLVEGEDTDDFWKVEADVPYGASNDSVL